MILGKVTGQVISTQKDPDLEGSKLLIVQDVKLADMKPAASYVVAVDAVGAGLGEFVVVVSGSSARMAQGMKTRPVDCAIVGIVDTIHLDGAVRYSKSDSAVGV